MSISRKDYLQQIIKLHERLIIASEEYEGISEEFILKQNPDISSMKEQWLVKVKDFKRILADMDNLEIPNAFEKEGNELKYVYENYVSCVEEKTRKFSIETMANGELEAIQASEVQAAEYIEDLIEALFDK
ncbi:hypothetical protein ABZ756_12080 [Mammaliicoccus sciuri]|uniref:Uncharacterized protein n=1 Tax=Sporosarcina newyorkensis TaxID=759851 RepID=A0A1T4YJM2_9BACL|nr:MULTISPECIES: hypothetical protein [Sporosarcina]MBY0221829.1 hypothetical protein [Sporosarcina aquimarina]SKB01475.1 hypothetical protein SAMN04244570_2735 [Sporosarcina newyorkensis]